MKKFDFFMEAMTAQEYRRRAWVISGFSLIKEDPEAWKKDPYPFRIVQTPSAFFFVNPTNTSELTLIEDAPVGNPIFNALEKIQLEANSVPNLTTAITTTYGNLLFNYTVLVYPFKHKVAYQNKRISPAEIENLVIERFRSDPEIDNSIRDDKYIYVSEWLACADALFYMAGFTQLWVPAATRKSMLPAPGIRELRTKLIKENQGRLHDPAAIANIDAQLVAYDRKYLEGDASMGFLIKNKSFNIVRKKLFGMHGAETGLSEGVDVELIERSLSEGWDISKFPAMNNSLRAGSFSRGAQTMLGGESVKWLLRASSNITVTADDCGTRLGNLVSINDKNLNFIVGFHLIAPTGSVYVEDREAAAKYIGKQVMVRSPMFCKLDKTDFCKCCVGDRLAQNPTALSSAVAEYGSAFLSLFMAAAHSKALTVAHMDFKTALF